MPIETYREKTYSGSRRFELFADAVSITTCEAFGREFTFTVPLNILEPTVSRTHIREMSPWFGLLILGSGAYSAFRCAQKHPPLTDPGFWVCTVFALIGLYLFWRAFRRVEAAVFCTTGAAPEFYICRLGPDVGRFPQFVERVAAQIVASRPSPPAPQA